jgi:membrane protein
MKGKDILPLLKETFASWSEDKAPRLAAALAYYTLFSIAPLVIIAIAVAGLAFGDEAARGQLDDQIRNTVGPKAAEAIQDMVRNASRPSHGILASVIGVLTLLFGAAGVFGQLKDALNTIWEVAPAPGRSFWGMVKDRFLSFAMVLVIGFLLMVSLVVSAALSGVSKYMAGMLPTVSWLGPVLDFVISLAVFTGLLALIYRVLPDAKIAWRDVRIGAFMTALLFAIGKILIGLYLGRSTVASAYGAAGSLVVLLLWVYYSAQILFFGAEFTQVYATRYGSRIVPADDAVPVTEEARAQQGIPRRRQAA